MSSPEISPGSNKTVVVAIAISAVVALLLLVCSGIFAVIGFSVIGGRNALQGFVNTKPDDQVRTKYDLRRLGLALLNYEAAYKRLPPAYTVDSQGKKLHGWRVILLPFMEEAPLFKAIDLSKPWDHPDNRMAFESQPPCYVNKNDGLAPGLTRYLTVIDPNSVFRGTESIRLADVADGMASTLLLYHTVPSKAIHWMQPDDSSIEEFAAAVRESNLGGPGTIVSTVDASLHVLGPDVSDQDLKAVVSASGGEIVHLHN